jgi:hypothetical protein
MATGASMVAATVPDRIVNIRHHRIILAHDLAAIYGVETRVLNQAVRRNAARFPHDFVFQLTAREVRQLQRSRSQSVILKRGHNYKHLPLAFTEHGAVMAATVLNSARAVRMSLFVVRAFVRLRAWMAEQEQLVTKLAEIERHLGVHDRQIREVVIALRRLLAPPAGALPRRIGFQVQEARKARARRRSA